MNRALPLAFAARHLHSIRARLRAGRQKCSTPAVAPELIAGVLQVIIRLPANLRPGELPVTIHAGDRTSQTRVTVSVR